jgi:hypothetical protein
MARLCSGDELAVVARRAPSNPSAAGSTGVEVVGTGEVKICPPAAAIGAAPSEWGVTARTVSEAGLVRGIGTFLTANAGLTAGFDAVRVSFADFGADLDALLDAALVLSFACVCDWPFGAFENGAAATGRLRATTPATANGQILFGRVRKSNGLILVWRESPVSRLIAIALKKLTKAKKPENRTTVRQMPRFVPGHNGLASRI